MQWPRSAGVGKGSNVPVPAARARLLVRRIALAHGLADIWLTEPDRGHGAGAQRRRKPRVSQNAGSTTRARHPGGTARARERSSCLRWPTAHSDEVAVGPFVPGIRSRCARKPERRTAATTRQVDKPLSRPDAQADDTPTENPPRRHPGRRNLRRILVAIGESSQLAQKSALRRRRMKLVECRSCKPVRSLAETRALQTLVLHRRRRYGITLKHSTAGAGSRRRKIGLRE